MTWTVFRFPVGCGAETGCTIAAGMPVAILAGKMRRCAYHAGLLGHAVNDEEVENERWRLEQEERAAETRRQASAAPSPRHRLTRPVTSWSSVADMVDTVDRRLPLGDRE